MIERRSVIGGFTTALAAGAVLGSGKDAAAAAPRPTLTAKVPPPIPGPRMNFSQADKVMSELGLDAIVVSTGTNLYHATGLDLTETRMGLAPGVFAVITRRADQRLALVAPAFLYYYTIALDHRDQSYPAYVYTAPAPGQSGPGSQPAAQPFSVFNDRGEAPLDAIESGRAAIVNKTIAAHAVEASVVFSLRQALKDTGVTNGRIAVDSPTVQRVTTEAAPQASIVDADDALRRIRQVKSAIEIELMRQASKGNVEAAIAAAHSVRAGADVRELRATYFAEAAKRGMRGVFMVIDRVSAPNYTAKFHDGQCFSIDCVSEYMGYHGDYARVVMIGEPPRPMKKVTDATGKAWESIRATLKPGIKFSDIRATGRDALKKLGVDYNISFTPHSVGLWHNDGAGSTGLPSLGDQVLEPGMVLSVDCPLLESGAGGSSHLEDLTLITANGSEPIHDIEHKTITV